MISTWLRHGAMDPCEGTPLWEILDRPVYRIDIFNLVIRVRKGKQSANQPYFASHLVGRLVKLLALVRGFTIFWSFAGLSLCPKHFFNRLSFSVCRHTAPCDKGYRHVLFLQVWSLWYLVRLNQLHPIRQDSHCCYMPSGVDRPRPLPGNNTGSCILFGAGSLCFLR